jgi:hypothetical protein
MRPKLITSPAKPQGLQPGGHETFSQGRRNTPETERRLWSGQNHTGTATMQFILELIRDYSHGQCLVALPLREDER